MREGGRRKSVEGGRAERRRGGVDRGGRVEVKNRIGIELL
jgi:hypothetical protein